jgi:elongator complex protein 3
MNYPNNFPSPHDVYFKAAVEILLAVKTNNITQKKALKAIINKTTKKFKVNSIPFWAIIWAYYHQDEIKLTNKELELLTIKKTRAISGILPLSVFTKPYPCKGQCLYCPSNKDMPKSYIESEPAVLRAVRNEFDPYKQVTSRLNQFIFSGHQPQKIELIIQGGTFSDLPNEYRIDFLKKIFNAANSWPNKVIKETEIEKAKKNNEKAYCRIIGITIETRPDSIDEKELLFLRMLGVTRVELGVQTLNNESLILNRRGHTIEDVIKATALLKEYGFKVCYHMMPGLPGSTPQRDKEDFCELFNNPNYMPDLLKIYPCVITKGSELDSWSIKNNYKPLSDQELVPLLIEIKEMLPCWVRVQRLGRDIPATEIVAGTKISNIRELVEKNLSTECKCIRCREIKNDEITNPIFSLTHYAASGGDEYFLEFKNKENNKLFASLRLRINNKQSVKGLEILNNAAIIREIHTYGKMTEIGLHGNIQHAGLGKKLIKEAEKIAKKEKCENIIVISGIGVRDYYRHLGYELKNEYMVKSID